MDGAEAAGRADRVVPECTRKSPERSVSTAIAAKTDQGRPRTRWPRPDGTWSSGTTKEPVHTSVPHARVPFQIPGAHRLRAPRLLAASLTGDGSERGYPSRRVRRVPLAAASTGGLADPGLRGLRPPAQNPRRAVNGGSVAECPGVRSVSRCAGGRYGYQVIWTDVARRAPWRLHSRTCSSGAECPAPEIVVPDPGQLLVWSVEADREGTGGTRPRAVAPEKRPRGSMIGEEGELQKVDHSTAGLPHPARGVRAFPVVWRKAGDRAHKCSLAVRPRGGVGHLEHGGIGRRDVEMSVGGAALGDYDGCGGHGDVDG